MFPHQATLCLLLLFIGKLIILPQEPFLSHPQAVFTLSGHRSTVPHASDGYLTSTLTPSYPLLCNGQLFVDTLATPLLLIHTESSTLASTAVKMNSVYMNSP
jgi:hypothetical protein